MRVPFVSLYVLPHVSRESDVVKPARHAVGRPLSPGRLFRPTALDRPPKQRSDNLVVDGLALVLLAVSKRRTAVEPDLQGPLGFEDPAETGDGGLGVHEGDGFTHEDSVGGGRQGFVRNFLAGRNEKYRSGSRGSIPMSANVHVCRIGV